MMEPDMAPASIWDAMRACTPGADSPFTHLNHASTSLPDNRTLQEQEHALQLEREMGAHRAAESVRPLLEQVPREIARLVCAEPHQVAVQPSASRGFAAALSAVAPGKALEVFVTPHEWAANLMCIEASARASLSVVRRGGTDWPEAFARALARRDRAREPVVSLPVVSTTGSFIARLQQVCEVVRAAGAWLFVDASQAVGRARIDVAALGADVLYFPARKWLRGPKGVAAAVFSDKALARFGSPAAPDLPGSTWRPGGDSLRHGDGAARFQSHDQNPALHLGLLTAIRCHRGFGVHATGLRIAERGRVLRGMVSAVPGVVIEPGTEAGFVCLRPVRADGPSVQDIGAALWRHGVNAGVITSRYAPLQLADDEALLRLTPHAFTTEEDMQRAVLLLDDATRGAAKQG